MRSIKLKRETDSIPSISYSEPNYAGHRIVTMRYAFCALILLLSAMGAYTLGLRLISQIHYLRAKNLMQQGYYGLAAHALQKASTYQPKDYKIHRQWGNAVYKLGELSPTTKGAYALADKAKAHFHEAFRLNPLDAQSAYGLAWQEDWLELLYSKLNSSQNAHPHNALPYYERAIRLKPNGIQYHFALARYLDRHKMQDKLLGVVLTLARIYPPTYYSLKKEDFWSPPVKTACRHGLQEAIKENILPAAAHMALVQISEEEKDWASAIAHYQQVFQLQPRKKTEKSYFRLGRLFLKYGDLQAARANFLKSLSLSRTREKRLERLYQAFKSEGLLNAFSDFYHETQQRFALLSQAGILYARSLIDLKQYDKARLVLEELNADAPTADTYYWLARIAEQQENWDQMELAIQRATVLEPENSHYRRIFFRLLKRMKKFESAERQLDFIIMYSNKPSASLYNEKAWLRWKQKDYGAALKAWQSAIRLKSDSAAYYARAAEANVMLGNWLQAKTYYQKAVQLDPQNYHYAQRYQELAGDEALSIDISL